MAVKNLQEIRDIFYNGYIEGAIKVLDVLEEAMKEEGTDHCKAEWLKNAREEFERIKLNSGKNKES